MGMSTGWLKELSPASAILHRGSIILPSRHRVSAGLKSVGLVSGYGESARLGLKGSADLDNDDDNNNHNDGNNYDYDNNNKKLIMKPYV